METSIAPSIYMLQRGVISQKMHNYHGHVQEWTVLQTLDCLELPEM